MLLTPTYNKNDILHRSLGFMDQLDPQPTAYIFLENNSHDGTLITLTEWAKTHPTTIIRWWLRDDAVQRMGNPFTILALIRQTLLNEARKRNADYAIFVDDDILLFDSDIITRLTDHRKPLVSASYSFPNAYHHGIFLNAIWPHDDGYQWRKSCTGLHPVCGVASGALCIRHDLLMDERVSFTPITNPQLSEDFHYCERALEHGYQPYLDCDVRVGHCFKATDMGSSLRYWHHRPWSRMPHPQPSDHTIKFYDFHYGKPLRGEQDATRFVVFMPPKEAPACKPTPSLTSTTTTPSSPSP